MSTIAPLPDCPLCHGTGKIPGGFCHCLARSNASDHVSGGSRKQPPKPRKSLEAMVADWFSDIGDGP